ncbi:thiamine-phosphate kinase [bacterium]|nr:thiamine-phosphate kinase [candidate division CSSED10-310 bacterium]
MLSELGEFDLIERFLSAFSNPSRDLVIPPGDDCAAFRVSPETLMLVTTDLLIEHVHFDLSTIHPRQLGWKAMAVNISDIAAMGGTPAFGFLSIALPKRTSTAWIDALAEGMSACCTRYHVTLAGGDTTGSLHDIVINIGLIGFTSPQRCIRRNGALPGDCIQVSGPFGGSAAGLKLLALGTPLNPLEQSLITAHLEPIPRVACGQALSQLTGVHAMIDVSDGLIQDLGHICHASGVGAIVSAHSVPVYPGIPDRIGRERIDPLNLALSGGEDYELVWTVSPECADAALASAVTAGALHAVTIGVIGEGQSVVVMLDGKPLQLARAGYDHFKP